MIVDEEDFDALVEAVQNGQMRLADTYFVSIIAQMLDHIASLTEAVESISEKLNIDSENDSDKNKITVEEKEPLAKSLSKTKKTEAVNEKEVNLVKEEL